MVAADNYHTGGADVEYSDSKVVVVVVVFPTPPGPKDQVIAARLYGVCI